MENASDCYLYGMDKDKAFDNVILAVVSNADTDIRNSRGDFISVMPMEVPQNVARRYLMLASDQGQGTMSSEREGELHTAHHPRMAECHTDGAFGVAD